MIMPVSFFQAAEKVAQRNANGGVFLCTGDGSRNNVMTIGWGGVLTMFGTGCFLAPVRASRFSYGLLRKNGAFTVCVPERYMKQELTFAGTESGRNVDKFVGHGLTPAPAISVNVPVVKECGLKIECEPIGFAEQNAAFLTPEVIRRWYPTMDDLHTLFLGKIVQCYFDD